MEITAKLRFLRMSPRKVRLVANMIKGLSVPEAQVQLKFLPKRAALPVLKTLNSAVANAQHSFQAAKDHLYVSKIVVDGGPMLKRWMPRAFGRASAIQKKTSHLTVVLSARDVAGLMKVEEKKSHLAAKATEEKARVQEVLGGEAEKQKKVFQETPKAERKERIAKERLSGFAKKIFRRKAV